jgi:DNA gyrase subunit A
MAKKKSKSGLDVNALIGNENIINSDISDEMEESYLTYAIKTIIGRALPDVRDGLKPVHRRILYGADQGGYLPTKKHVKNAKIVGDVMGNLHPHGDGSIYEALTAMSRPWTYRYPLIDFQGNKGSYDGDDSAAMRYTEGRLGKLALVMLRDIDNKCVNFKANYAETMDEPEVLPGSFPNLLLNGGSGIAVGYTTDIPSHQLGEVVDGIIETIKNPNIELTTLMQYIKGPDFPLGGYLVNNGAIRELYEKGKASLILKAKYVIEQNDESNNTQIVFTELPPDTNKPKLLEKIHEICIEKKDIPRVIDVRDESKGSDVRVVVELHKTAVPDIVINQLYEATPLQKNSTFILRAIVNQAPKILSLKEIIEYYIEHRREVITRRSQFILDKTKFKLHIQEGLKIVTSDIKKAIKIIEESDTTEDARQGLILGFGLSEAQANEVLEIKLRQLTKLNKKDIDNLINELNAEIASLENILSGQIEIDKVIIKELKDLKKEFNDERRTIIIDEQEAKKIEVVSGNNDPIALILTSKNTIKHITLKALDDMFKNGALKERTEVFTQGLKCTMSDQFILILNTGEYVKIGFSDLMGNLPIDEQAQIKAIITYNDSNPGRFVVVMTKKGIVEKIRMSGFKARNGKVSSLIQLEPNDEIIGARVLQQNGDSETDDSNVITLATKEGIIHRFYFKSFKDTSAGSRGLPGISLGENDEVVSFDITDQNQDDNQKIITFVKFNDGTYGMKSMKLSEFKPKGRIAQGVRGVDFAKKQPGVVCDMVTCSNDFFTVDSKGNVTIYQFVKLPDYNRYNKPELIQNEVNVSKFFLE